MLQGSPAVLVLADPARPAPDLSALRQDFTGVVVATSGSTGTPKWVMLSRQALIAAAEASQERLGGPGQWVNPLSPWCVAGMMTRVRAILAGKPHFDVLPHLDDLAHTDQPGFISVVPPQLHHGLLDPDISRKLGAFTAVLVGGSPLGKLLRSQAEDAGISVVSTYGMSETCGGVVYDGLPLSGVEVRLDKERVVLDTPTVFDGYLGDPKLTADLLDQSRFMTSDRGRFVEGRLEILGRIDDVILSGGQNVDLGEVQRRLDEFFAQQTACFVVDDQVWGTTILVASTGPGLPEIRDKLSPYLTSAARPRGVLEVSTLPRTSSGKIDRIALVEEWRGSGQRT